jgi:hypothetical protein
MRITGVRVYRLDLPLAGSGYAFAKGKHVTSVDTARCAAQHHRSAQLQPTSLHDRRAGR